MFCEKNPLFCAFCPRKNWYRRLFLRIDLFQRDPVEALQKRYQRLIAQRSVLLQRQRHPERSQTRPNKKNDWRSLMAPKPVALKGDEPDFSEEGWARRRPKKR